MRKETLDIRILDYLQTGANGNELFHKGAISREFNSLMYIYEYFL